MTDTPPRHQYDDPEEVKIFSEDLEQFLDALECLYVFDNLGGRLQFREQWPFTALRIFPPELIQFDEIGTKDKEHRRALELQADQNRENILADIARIQEKHNSGKPLEPTEIQDFIDQIGRETALHIFDISIVDRFAPAAIEPEPEPEPENAPHLEPEPIPAPETETKTEIEPEPDIQPISTPAPKSARPNLAEKLTLFHTEPPGANVKSYKDIVRESEKMPINPNKNQYSALFNLAAQH